VSESEKKAVKQVVQTGFDVIVMTQVEFLIEMMQVEFLIEMMPVEIHLWVVSDGVKSKVTVMKTVEFQLEEIVGLLLTGYFSASCPNLSLENFGCPHH
jgi:hypothetical protein